LELQFTPHEKAGVVTVIGNIDAQTALNLTNYTSAQIAKGCTCLVYDLSQVNFMSSAGLRVILIALKESRRQRGDLRLAALQPGVEKVLKLAGFNRILKSYASVEEALASFR
jgi:anti-sigma B factor antagonist